MTEQTIRFSLQSSFRAGEKQTTVDITQFDIIAENFRNAAIYEYFYDLLRFMFAAHLEEDEKFTTIRYSRGNNVVEMHFESFCENIESLSSKYDTFVLYTDRAPSRSFR